MSPSGPSPSARAETLSLPSAGVRRRLARIGRGATTLALDLLVMKPIAIFVWWLSHRANTIHFVGRDALLHRIDETTIDFNAKINSVEYRKTNTRLKVDASLEAKAGWLWGSAKLKVSTSFQRTTQQGNSVNRTYSLAIHVRAVQDEMPAGMEKMLSILEGAITSMPALTP